MFPTVYYSEYFINLVQKPKSTLIKLQQYKKSQSVFSMSDEYIYIKNVFLLIINLKFIVIWRLTWYCWNACNTWDLSRKRCRSCWSCCLSCWGVCWAHSRGICHLPPSLPRMSGSVFFAFRSVWIGILKNIFLHPV